MRPNQGEVPGKPSTAKPAGLTMTIPNVLFVPEEPSHDAAIEAINADAFGPGRFARAAYKIREGGPHDRSLSFVALIDGAVVASVRMTPIAAGEGRAMLLGPLAVMPSWKNLGFGRKLVAIALDAAKAAGWGAVVLVGDAPYYGPLGFAVMPRDQITMPRPVDPARLLVAELVPGAAEALRGPVRHAATRA